jgi:hypothetical protein
MGQRDIRKEFEEMERVEQMTAQVGSRSWSTRNDWIAPAGDFAPHYRWFKDSDKWGCAVQWAVYYDTSGERQWHPLFEVKVY